jgi:carboxyl-terminal processing protease
MNKKVSISMLITIVILAMTVTFSITMLMAMRLFDSTVTSVKEKEAMYNKIAEIDKYIRSNDYYSIDEDQLYDAIATGYVVGTGDKYAAYYTASAYAELLDVQNGKRIGIGVELGRDQSGYAKVTKVYDGSPAAELGLTRGCYIIAIDGVDVKSMSSMDTIESRLRGESGTVVSITWRDTEAVEHTNDVTRSGYSTSTVDYEMADGNVGYIRIRQFDTATPSELDYAIRSLSNAGAVGFMIDLRDNAGGLLDETIRCLELLCPEGTLAYAESSNGTRTALGDSAGDTVTDLPIVCIVNGNTASAAELFASCLRNMSGALLVGSNTLGKGTIQSSPQRLSDGSAVVITVAKLLSSDGSSFDGVGLTVDVERILSADEEAVYYDYTVSDDPQIQRALNTVQYLTGSSTVSAVNENTPAPEETAEPSATPEAEAESESGSDEADAESESTAGSEETTGTDSEAASSATQN